MKKIKENSSFTKKSIPERIVYAIVFLLFFLYAASLLYPFFWGVLSSLKEVDEYLDSPFSFPSKWLFSNYASAFEMLQYNDANFIQMIFNSVWFTVGGTLIAGFVVCMTAYVVAKYDFKGKGFVYALSLVIMVVPVVGTLPAQYRLYNQLHITDSPLLLITYASGFGFNFIVMYGFFKSLPGVCRGCVYRRGDAFSGFLENHAASGVGLYFCDFYRSCYRDVERLHDSHAVSRPHAYVGFGLI